VISMRMWMRRPAALVGLSAVALAALLSGGLVVAHAVDGTPTADASPSPAPGSNGDNNAAVAVNTKDGKTVYAFKLKIVQVSDTTVDASNAAVAVNSGCAECSTVAVAFEGVVVIGSPTTFTPTNLALAMNSDCSGCTAFADAYQQVVQTSTRVRVTRQGRQQIAAIRHDLDVVKHSDLTLDQIRARVAADEEAFAAVLLHDLVPVGHVMDAAPAGATDVSDNPDAAPASAAPSASSVPGSSAPGSSAPASVPPPSPSGASDTTSPSPDASPSPAPSPTA
jgi:putative peptide zinc metalloprotease protein